MIPHPLHCAYEGIAGAMSLANNENKKSSYIMDTMHKDNAYSRMHGED